ncbi:hypothetical protein FS749_008373 [Ceratobasidium sp. UAMH 11750]|nr:hypothetical protein FS749_008373 [Ceratobasidium sp. UAMH 11750]
MDNVEVFRLPEIARDISTSASTRPGTSSTPRLSIIWAIRRAKHPLLAARLVTGSNVGTVHFEYRWPNSVEEAMTMVRRDACSGEFQGRVSINIPQRTTPPFRRARCLPHFRP